MTLDNHDSHTRIEVIERERALNIDPNYIDARKNLELARSLAEIKVDTETRQEIR